MKIPNFGLKRTNPVGSTNRSCWVVFVLLAVSPLLAQEPDRNFENAAATVEADLAAELKKLAALRDKIAEEKPPLARSTNEIAAELREKQRRAELASQERDALIHDLNTLSSRVKIWRDERAYIDSLLADFRKQHEAHLSLGEAAAKAEQLLAADTDRAAQLALAESALARLEQVMAGQPRVIENGIALSSDGVGISGDFVEAGPVNWFVSEDGKTAGLISASRALEPQIVPGTADPTGVKKLVSGQTTTATFDPTLGTAIALDVSETSIRDEIRAGGFWIFPILLLAVVATLAAILKWIQLGRIRELRPAVVQKILRAIGGGDSEKAKAELRAVRHPARAILQRGIELHEQPHDKVEEALYEKYLEAQPPLQRWLPFIAIAAATAPLLGLLGTVTGMIHTFELINLFGTGNAKSLASGISEALVTTKFGLIVAIPALILHALLSRKVKGIRAAMEMASLAFLNGLKAKT
ncbi:MAG: hypothetical protein HKN23_03225 [Verrucomicrobiales bacterium]|nr:hypothetical protein [Verrucomicrobiales bacterium]